MYIKQAGTEDIATIIPLFAAYSWVLNDLFVAPEARVLAVGLQLIARAKQLAKATGACQIMLQTAADNMTAQGLYEKLGYQRDNDFYVYTLALGEVS